MRLRDVAHSRVGEEGVLVSVSLVAFDARDYPLLEQVVTADRVREHLAGLVQRTIVRYAKPHLGALNFMLWPVGTSFGPRSPSIISALLNMEIPAVDGAALTTTRTESRLQPARAPIS